MRDKEIEKKTEFLWEGTIKSNSFNWFHNEISLTIEVNYGEKKGIHELTFIGVSAYHFSNESGERRKELYEYDESEGDRMELTSVNYVEEIEFITKNAQYPWLSRYSTEANVYLEIWGKVLFIECTGMKIDDQIYMFDSINK